MSSSTSPASAEKIVPIKDTSFTGFYRHMTASERRTFWACAAGWTLDGMDFMITACDRHADQFWGVDNGTAGLAATVTLLSSALGGWLAGFISDRIGRVLTLQITILWFSFFSLLCAFAQDFNQLLIARALLGLALARVGRRRGAHGETIRAQYRGRAVGAVQSGWAVGWGLAVLMQAILFSIFPLKRLGVICSAWAHSRLF